MLINVILIMVLLRRVWYKVRGYKDSVRINVTTEAKLL